MRRYDNLDTLQANQLPGADVWNTLIRYIRGSGSANELLVINPAADGDGVSYEVSKAGIERLAKSVGNSYFRMSLETEGSTTKLTIGEGLFLSPSVVLATTGAEDITLTGDYVRTYLHVTKTGVSYTYAIRVSYNGTMPSIYDADGASINIGLGECYKDKGEWDYRYTTYGAVLLPYTPYIWIPGYSKTDRQSLDHDTGGNLVWTTYGECEQ